MVACVCGVAVREGNVILGVDMCTDGIPHYITFTTLELPEGYGVTKSDNGNYFEVTNLHVSYFYDE